MDISPYADRLRDELAAVSAGAAPEVREAADRLGRALDPAVRLTLFGVLADAAAEISADLATASVTARLTGRDIEFVVDGLKDTFDADIDAGRPTAYGHGAPDPTEEAGTEDGEPARITVRLPEGIKERAERLAESAGQSLNSWIVATLRAATRGSGASADPAGMPFLAAAPPGNRPGRMTGWL